MGRRRNPKHTPNQYEDDSLSEEVDDCSEEVIRPVPVKKKRVESVQWIDKFQPQNISEVCINPRKMKEIREILEPMIAGQLPAKLLILSGPSGSSKSTAIKSLANHLMRKKPDVFRTESERVVEYFDSSLDDIHQPGHFQDFMDGCKYRVGSNLAVVLVEELPNVFHNDTLQSFRNCLRDWIHTEGLKLPPLVLCLTEVELDSDRDRRANQGYYSIENNLTVETLLGRDLVYLGLALGAIKRVKLLPIAKTFMKRTLSKIAGQENLRPLKELERFLAATYETGDIRSLVCNLQFWAMQSRHTGVDFVRENQITLFHAVGKIIHSSGKFSELDDDMLDYCTIKAVLDTYNNFGLLHLALLENYQIVNGLQFDIEVAASLVDSLSINDTLTPMEESEEYGIRAARNQLRTVSAKSGQTQPMKFPRHFKMLKESNKVKREIAAYARYVCGMQVLFQEANLLDGYYLPLIYNSFLYRMKNGRKRFNYNRLGGTLKEIFADDDLPVMEHETETTGGARDQFLVDIENKIREEEEGGENEVMSEEIETDGTDEDFNDSLNDSQIGRLISFQQTQGMSQVQVQGQAQTQSATQDDDFLDDEELDMLVSLGRL